MLSTKTGFPKSKGSIDTLTAAKNRPRLSIDKRGLFCKCRMRGMRIWKSKPAALGCG